MTLRFSDKPVLSYGGNQGSVADIWQRFPQGAQPIATAPERTSTPIIGHEANGASHWMLHHHNGWQKLESFRDWRDPGRVNWRMTGQYLNPVAWSYPQKKA